MMEELFNKQYPKLNIVKTLPYKNGMTFIFARGDSPMEMDPFFVYDPKKEKIYQYQPTANFEEFKTILEKLDE